MIIRNVKLIIIAISIIPSIIISQPSIYLSLGVKIGYSFGTFSQPIGGFEISVSRWQDREGVFNGACLSYEISENFKLIHFGVELGKGAMAGSIGPSLMLNEDESHFGATATVWTGIGILPYVRQNWLSGYLNNYSEIGIFLKVPKQLSGPKLSLSQ
jgi:hypothetical protein